MSNDNYKDDKPQFLTDKPYWAEQAVDKLLDTMANESTKPEPKYTTLNATSEISGKELTLLVLEGLFDN